MTKVQDYPNEEVKVKTRDGWEGAGRTGVLLSRAFKCGGQHWSAVKWDDEEDPDVVKTASLSFLSVSWCPVHVELQP